MHSVVVTGVSTGIGWGTTKVLIRNGLHVFGSVRKQADADRLTQEFGSAFTPLLFDITDEAAIQAAALLVRERLAGETLFGLVNNAGIATAGPLMHQPLEEFRHQIDVNLVGQLIVTRAFLPLLGTDRALKGDPGRIHRRIHRLEARSGGLIRKPAARATDLWYRRDYCWAWRGCDTDLGQSCADRRFGLRAYRVRRYLAAFRREFCAGRPQRISARADRRDDSYGADHTLAACSLRSGSASFQELDHSNAAAASPGRCCACAQPGLDTAEALSGFACGDWKGMLE